MGVTPGTGTAISIGRVWASFDPNKDGFSSGKNREYPPTVAQRPAGGIALRGTLGIQITSSYKPSGSLTFGTQITSGPAALSADFLYLGTPDTYPT